MRSTHLLIALIALSGCGESGPELGKVTGKVTIDGTPIRGVAITFRPRGSGTAAYGGTNQDGEYSLQFTRDKEGAMPGDYFVDLETSKPSAEDIADAKANNLPEPPPYVPIPRQYRTGEAFPVTVKSGDNVIDFEMTSK